MYKPQADRVIIEDLNHRKWIVYAKYGPVSFKRRIYKNYVVALVYAQTLLDYYQIADLTELSK